jgi:hypothetical protein
MNEPKYPVDDSALNKPQLFPRITEGFKDIFDTRLLGDVARKLESLIHSLQDGNKDVDKYVETASTNISSIINIKHYSLLVDIEEKLTKILNRSNSSGENITALSEVTILLSQIKETLQNLVKPLQQDEDERLADYSAKEKAKQKGKKLENSIHLGVRKRLNNSIVAIEQLLTKYDTQPSEEYITNKIENAKIRNEDYETKKNNLVLFAKSYPAEFAKMLEEYDADKLTSEHINAAASPAFDSLRYKTAFLSHRTNLYLLAAAKKSEENKKKEDAKKEFDESLARSRERNNNDPEWVRKQDIINIFRQHFEDLYNKLQGEYGEYTSSIGYKMGETDGTNLSMQNWMVDAIAKESIKIDELIENYKRFNLTKYNLIETACINFENAARAERGGILSPQIMTRQAFIYDMIITRLPTSRS